MLEYEPTSTTGFVSAASPPFVALPFLYELRPLSLGEILDRTFSIYRKRFSLYVGLSSVAAAITTVGTFVSLSLGLVGGKIDHAKSPRVALMSGAVSLVTALVYIVAYSITQAATVSAVSAHYLGEEATIGSALRSAGRHWFRYILIVFWQTWSAMWLPFALFIPAIGFVAVPKLGLIWLGYFFIFLAVASLVYSPFAYIRNSLGIVASAVEDLKVRKAMRRSKVLVAGHKARVLVIFLLMWILGVAAGVLQQIPTALLIAAHGWSRVGLETLVLMLTFVGNALVAPVGAIALCLFYVDERVRKEGFDVEMLMNRSMAPPAATGIGALPSPFTSELS
jgi:hypothetical protein